MFSYLYKRLKTGLTVIVSQVNIYILTIVSTTNYRISPLSLDQTNISNVTSLPPSSAAGSQFCNSNVKPKATVSVAASQETDVSLAQRKSTSNSVGASEPSPLNKQPPPMDVRNPSIAKVVPFSHEPAINSAKSSVEVSTPSEVPKTDTDTNLHISPKGQVVMQSSLPQTNLKTTLSLSPGYFHVSEDGCMTIFASGKGGHLQQLYKAVCRCQLRERALKYADKGKTKCDSIVIDSDEEDENRTDAAEENIIQGIFRYNELIYILLL